MKRLSDNAYCWILAVAIAAFGVGCALMIDAMVPRVQRAVQEHLQESEAE